MKLQQIYAIMGWPLRFWRTKTLPPAPVAHDIPFDECVRSIKTAPSTSEESNPPMSDEEFKTLCSAMDVRYSSLKQGERLGKLSPEELQELYAMETGHGWRLDLSSPPNHERLAFKLLALSDRHFIDAPPMKKEVMPNDTYARTTR
jgi:hypothetical protein